MEERVLQEKEARRAARCALRVCKRQEKVTRRALWKKKDGRRRLQAASGLLCLGSFGITYLCDCVYRAFGLRALLLDAVGILGVCGVVGGTAAVLTLLCLYPLWLGMRGYAAALYGGKDGEGELFFYYADRRGRRFAFAEGCFQALRCAVFFGLFVVGGYAGTRLSLFFSAQAQIARATLAVSLTLLLLLLLPCLFFVQGMDFTLTRAYYRAGGVSLVRARRLSVADMKGRRGECFRLYLRTLPGVLLSLLLFGVGIPLFVLPRFLFAAAGFSRRPT